MPFIELVAQRRSPTPPPGMQPPENAKDWFRVENSTDDEDATDVLIYDSVGGWFGMYADEMVEALDQITTSKINLRLNSPGGSVFEGIAIANALRAHPAHVTVYVDSLAASIASVIMLAGDRIIMRPQSQVMIHNASGACYGDATEMTKMADLLDKQSRNIAEAYAQHTGRPLAEWQQYMADETWFTAEEAVAVGLADEAMPMRPKKSEQTEEPAALASVTNRAWDLSMYRYAGREQAPEPKTAAASFANDGIASVMNQSAVSVSAGLVTGLDTVSNMTRGELVALIREVVQSPATASADETEPEDAKKKLPAFLQPDEDEEEEEEEESGEETDDASETDLEASTEEPSASISAGDGDPPSENPVDTGPGDAEEAVENTETSDENDEWFSLVDRLIPVASPSADDVFNMLKEAW